MANPLDTALRAAGGRGRIDAKEAQIFWDRFFSSTEYRDNLKLRIIAGEAGHMEVLLHHMVYGKPKETLALQGEGDGIFMLRIGDRVIKAQVLDGGEVRALPEGTVLDGEATPVDVSQAPAA